MGVGGDWCKMVTLLPTCHSKLLGQAGHFFMALWAMPREGQTQSEPPHPAAEARPANSGQLKRGGQGGIPDANGLNYLGNLVYLYSFLK